MRRVQVWVNPLDLFESLERAPTAEETLGFMCTPGVASDSEGVRARYQAITSEQPNLFAPPADERILNQLVWPLRHAKRAHRRQLLGTIALAGSLLNDRDTYL